MIDDDSARIELHPSFLARFIRSVAVLALPYEGQLAWLRSLGLGEPGIADELALELDEGVLLSGQFVDARWITREFREKAMALQAVLDELEGPEHEDVYRLSSLRDAPVWARVRELATETLQTI